MPLRESIAIVDTSNTMTLYYSYVPFPTLTETPAETLVETPVETPAETPLCYNGTESYAGKVFGDHARIYGLPGEQGCFSYTGCTFRGCAQVDLSMTAGGGAIDLDTWGIVHITGCSFIDCTSKGDGGALHIGGGDVFVYENCFDHCKGSYGGAIDFHHCGRNNLVGGRIYEFRSTTFCYCDALHDGGADQTRANDQRPPRRPSGAGPEDDYRRVDRRRPRNGRSSGSERPRNLAVGRRSRVQRRCSAEVAAAGSTHPFGEVASAGLTEAAAADAAGGRSSESSPSAGSSPAPGTGR